MREQTFTLSDSASESLPAERAAFIRRTYTHLAVALLLFTGLEFYMVNSPFAEELAISMTGGMSWLLVLALFIGVSYIANTGIIRKFGTDAIPWLGIIYNRRSHCVFTTLIHSQQLCWWKRPDSDRWIDDPPFSDRYHRHRFHN